MRSNRKTSGDDSVKLRPNRIKDFWKPLSVREKLIYGAVLLLLLVLLFGQTTGANTDDVGKIIQIPARQCIADVGWENPELAAGQPEYLDPEAATPIEASDATIKTDEISGLVCSAFEESAQIRVDTSVTIYLANRDAADEPSEVIVTENIDSTPDFTTAEITGREPVKESELEATTQTSIDDLLQVELTTVDSPDDWQLIGLINNADLASDPTQHSIILPNEFVDKYQDLLVRITPLHAGTNADRILIDSVAITYIVGGEKDLRVRPKNSGDLDEDAVWSLPYAREFEFEMVVHDPNVSLARGLSREITDAAGSSEPPEIETTIQLESKNTGEIIELENPETQWKSNSVTGDDVWDVKVDMPSSLEPGDYTFTSTVILDDGSVASFSQDFTWGVLAMNFDASIYEPGDSVNTAMAVLNETGHSVCGAQLELEVKLESRTIARKSTANGGVVQNETCDQYIPNPPPDYFAEFDVNLVGEYSVVLTATTANGTFQITDSVVVEENPSLVIKREGPTRIYPIFNNSMVISLISDVDQTVQIKEYLPASFEVEGASFAEPPTSQVVEGDTRILTWTQSLEAGVPRMVGYEFDAPDISPEFYLLGPVDVELPGKEVISETRSWQLAGDAVGDYAIYREATGTETITTSLSNQTWDTTVTEGTAFTISGTDDTIDLADAGHYYLAYNLALNGSSGRSETNALVDLAGTDLEYGRGTCYVRRGTGVNECWLSGSAIIDASAGDDVLIEAQRTDTGVGTVTRRPNESGISLVKLDDTWDYLRINEAGGGQTFNSATFADITWDTNDEVDAGSFAHDTVTNSEDIEIIAPGHYLVSTNVMFRANAGTSRRNNEIRLVLNGTEIEGTRTTSFMRGNESTQDHSANYTGIIEIPAASSTEELEDDFDATIDAGDWDTSGNGTVGTDCDLGSGNSYRLDATTGTRELESVDFDIASGGTITFDLYGAGADLTECEEPEAADDLELQYSTNGGGVWTNIATYDASDYTSVVQVTESFPAGAETSSTRFRFVQPSYSTGGAPDGFDHWSFDDITVDADGVNVLNLQGRCESETCGNVTNVGGQSGFAMVKLPESGRYLRLHESGGTQTVDGTDDPITWDSQDEIDSDFSHSTGTNPSRINIDRDDDYLFFSTFYSDRGASTSSARHQPRWEYRVSGSSTLQYGSTAKYNRGDNGTTGSRTGGDSTATILENLQDTDYVEVINTDESTGTDSLDLFTGDRQAVQAVNLTSLFASDPFTEQLHFRWRNDLFIERMEDDFDPGIDASEWADTTGMSADTFCSSTSGNALHSSGGTDDVAETNDYDVEDGGVLVFDLYMATSNSGSCNAPEAGEDVLLEYSINGGTGWSTIATYDEANFDPITTVTQPIPAAAMTDSTRFRFTQTANSGETFDHWVIDEFFVYEANDLNGEGGWLAAEDSNAVGDASKGDQLRLRFEVANTGISTESSARTYELEFADKGSNSSCSAATGWTGIADASDEMNMFTSSNITPDGEATTVGLLANTESYTYVNGEGREAADTTGSIGPLDPSEYTEIEYTIEVNDDAVTGHTYCFRVYDTTAGDVLDGYVAFPELTVGSTTASTSTGLGEAGTITAPADGAWTTINFLGTYTSPVIVGLSNTHNTQNALVFEARNVGSTSAEVRLCESEGSTTGGCDTHAAETIGYMVVDETVADTTDGIEAGTFTTSGADDTTNVTTVYDTAFSTAPSVFANVNTVDDADQPTEVIINSVTTANFNAGLCQHLNGSNDLCDTTHSTETVGWIAIEQGNEPFSEQFDHSEQNIDTDGGTWVTVNFAQAYATAPVLIGASQTDTGGQDPEIDNGNNVTTTTADIRFCEMDATDTCDNHGADDFAWLAIEAGQFADRFELDQDTFRFYDNENDVDPSTPLGAENTAVSGIATDDVIRIRMALQSGELDLPADAQDFKLQYATRTSTCSAVSTWTDVGAESSSTVWRGFDNATTADEITTSLLNGGTNELQSYVEENDSPLNPAGQLDGERGEWDFVVENHAATEGTDYCFRMTTANGNPLHYTRYPWLTTSGSNDTPSAPTNLIQQKTDDTVIVTDGWTNETSVKFTADVSDTDSADNLRLCVEVDEIGTPFSDTEDGCGDLVAYTGTALEAEVTLSGYTDDTSYHWQARVLDGGGLYSSWVSYDINLETENDFSVDITDPTATVYDGTVEDVDADFNNGLLNELSSNWDGSDASSGVANYDISIGTTPGATDVLGWTDLDLVDSTTQTSLTLQTSQAYYYNVRITDVATNQAVVSSDGQLVAPTLSFSVSPSGVAFDILSAGNSFTDTETSTLTTSTNAYNGYVVRAFATSVLTSQYSDIIGFFDGGSYLNPDGWLPADRGFGYTSTDTLVQGVNLFNPVTCLGGNPSPCYAPFSTTGPGDIVADNVGPISGTPITNENFTITHRVTTDSSQEQGTYISEVVFSAIPIY